MLSIREIETADADLWNAFALNQPCGAITHLYQWKLAIETAYGLETRYLGGFDDKEIGRAHV